MHAFRERVRKAGGLLATVFVDPQAGLLMSLQSGFERQRVDLFQDDLEPLFQLFFRPWLLFCLRKLSVVCEGATIKIGSFVQQLEFWINIC